MITMKDSHTKQLTRIGLILWRISDLSESIWKLFSNFFWKNSSKKLLAGLDTQVQARYKVIQVFVPNKNFLQSFDQYFGAGLSAVEHHNEIEEIKEALRNCLALANRDPDIEELCFGAVFNSDYFWY